jgi:hypothetical protein
LCALVCSKVAKKKILICVRFPADDDFASANKLSLLPSRIIFLDV